MTRRSRSDLDIIERHIERLKQSPWLDQSRRWWPDYLFHCTDIRNVVRILQSGELLSRVQAKEASSLAVDIAAPDIISKTDPKWQDHVRLYFRPKTPTQYANEGFRPKEAWEYGAHCPVPVYLLFDASSVLSRADCLFTDGNVASGSTPVGGVRELEELPFKFIYHDTWFDPSDRQFFVYHRNAEVLVPKQLGLEDVREVNCRSQAEYETLLHLLPPDVRSRWVRKIGVRPDRNLFHNSWTFVQQAEMNGNGLLFRFNEATKTPGPFGATVEIATPALTGKWHSAEFRADKPLRLGMGHLGNSASYDVRLFLDQQLAFAGHYQEMTLPF